jgi:hypothetical protein
VWSLIPIYLQPLGISAWLSRRNNTAGNRTFIFQVIRRNPGGSSHNLSSWTMLSRLEKLTLLLYTGMTTNLT